MDGENGLVDILTEMGLSDEQIEELLGLRGIAEKQQYLTGQTKFAQSQMQPQVPQGYHIRGRQFGPGPWSQAAYGVQQGLAGAERLRAMKQREAAVDEATRRRAELMRSLRSRRSPTYGSMP